MFIFFLVVQNARKSTIRAWLNILASYLHRSSWQLCCVDHCIIWDRNLARTSSHCMPKSLNMRYHMIDVIYQTEMTMNTYPKSKREFFIQIQSYHLKLKIFLIYLFKPCINFNTGSIVIPKVTLYSLPCKDLNAPQRVKDSYTFIEWKVFWNVSNSSNQKSLTLLFLWITWVFFLYNP